MSLREQLSAAAEALADAENITAEDWETLRATLRSDAFLFTVLVCGHEDLIPELHAPLLYAVCGQTDKLIEALNSKEFDSYVTTKFREELWRRNIKWNEPEGRERLDKQLDFLNIRWFRGSFKSSCATHAAPLFMATNDPNITLKITHAVDIKAWEFCSQIGETIRSDVYQFLYPERIPERPDRDITEKRIDLGGRTVSRPQGTINAGGYLTKDTGAHYDRFIIDDLVVEENATPAELARVHTWLRNLEGFKIEAPGVRVRRIHVGTKWDENDDDAFLTRKEMASACLTIRVPIEEYPSDVVNIMERGTPTFPQFYPSEKFAAKQISVLGGDENDKDGIRSWRCNFLLDATIGGGKLFPNSIVDDPERTWGLFPYHPQLAAKSKVHESRFLVSRLFRDEQGRPVDKRDTTKPLDREALTREGKDWRSHAKFLVFDPWKDLDRVVTLDPAWKEGGDHWAATAAAIDFQGVKFPLEIRSAQTGMEGWIDALADLCEIYQPRVIGFGKGGVQEKPVEQAFRTDPRLRKWRGRVVPLKETSAKIARIRSFVAEHLRMYRLLMPPMSVNTSKLPPALREVSERISEGSYACREEMKNYRGAKEAIDAILDTLWMIDAVARRKANPEGAEERKRRQMEYEQRRRAAIDPYVGVPLCA